MVAIYLEFKKKKTERMSKVLSTSKRIIISDSIMDTLIGTVFPPL